jgi:hypothetical protein
MGDQEVLLARYDKYRWSRMAACWERPSECAHWPENPTCYQTEGILARNTHNKPPSRDHERHVLLLGVKATRREGMRWDRPRGGMDNCLVLLCTNGGAPVSWSAKGNGGPLARSSKVKSQSHSTLLLIPCQSCN